MLTALTEKVDATNTPRFETPTPIPVVLVIGHIFIGVLAGGLVQLGAVDHIPYAGLTVILFHVFTTLLFFGLAYMSRNAKWASFLRGFTTVYLTILVVNGVVSAIAYVGQPVLFAYNAVDFGLLVLAYRWVTSLTAGPK